MAASSIPQDEVLKIKRNGWADNFFRPLLVTIMIMCFNLSLVNLVRLVSPTWRGGYFLLGILLLTIEAIYSYRVLNTWHLGGGSRFRYRLAEWAVLILILKLLSLAGKSTALIWIDLQAMWKNPFNILNVEFYLLLTLGMFAWIAATSTMEDFEALYDPYSIHTRPLDNLATRFFWGGTILVVISGISQWIARAGVASLVDLNRPSLSGILLNVLVYFTAGLVLLSQVNLTRLLVGWQFQKITITRSFVKQWARYGLIFLGIITAVIFFLPTSYSLGLLTSAAIVIQNVLEILVFLVHLLLFLIALPFMWIASLFEPPTEPRALLPPQMPPLPTNPADTTPTPWWEAVRSLLFWLLVLASGGYLIKIYFGDHPELLQWFKSIKIVSLVGSLLRQLWQQLWGLAQAGLEVIPKKIRLIGDSNGPSATTSRLSWLRLRGLSPKAQIVRYYLNILQRAEKQGLPRRTSQTPYEYEPDLSQATPELQPEVKALTEAFVAARYSQALIADEQASLVRQYWQRIRREFKRLKRKPPVEGH